MARKHSFLYDRPRWKNEPASHGEHYIPTDVEHYANMVTHGIWILPSLWGFKRMAENSSSPSEMVVLCIYGMALFFLFTMSTVYHCLSFIGANGLLKHFFHLGDRAVIYIFIAASYTPWLVLKDFGGIGNFTIWVVWTGAILGVLYQFLFHHRYKIFDVAFYLIVGVCPAYAVVHMADPSGIHELAIGGALYVSGVVFFKMDGYIPFAHAIWHCFVFVGALSHFYAINKYLVGSHGRTSAMLHSIP